MLRNVKDLEGCAIRATDGTIGHVTDLYFDDLTWAVRYLVVETGHWLASRKVLISPIAVGQPDWESRVLPVSITRSQVQLSPDIDTDKPVSRQHEMLYLGYYGYPYYWAGDGLWGQGSYPGVMMLGLGGVAIGCGLRLSRSSLNVLVLVAALPSASNVPMLAERFGADSARVARIVLLSTALAFLSFSAAVALVV